MSTGIRDDRITPGRFHRLGIAARPGNDLGSWLREVLGARPSVGGMRQALGLPMHAHEEVSSVESGARSEIHWLGDVPICLLVPTDESGQLAHYVARHGTGLHSVAWTVEDLWASDAKLRRQDVRLTGVDLPGRHFFMHPADSEGLLIEWTDTEFDSDPRDGAALPDAGDSVVKAAGVPWFTVVVKDPMGSAKRLSELMVTEQVTAGPMPDPASTSTLDLAIGSTVVRLVSPLTTASPYASALEDRGRRLHSAAVSLAASSDLAALEEYGVRVTMRDGGLAWSDPATTAGVQFEWVLPD